MEPQKTIAIADKERGLSELIESIASEIGFQVRKMIVSGNTSPQDVVSFVQDTTPDLILLAENYLDISNAPEVPLKDWSVIKQGEGIGALVEIRKRGYDAPVYMISGSPKYEKEAMAKGANGYMPATGNIETLKEFLTSAVIQS